MKGDERGRKIVKTFFSLYAFQCYEDFEIKVCTAIEVEKNKIKKF